MFYKPSVYSFSKYGPAYLFVPHCNAVHFSLVFALFSDWESDKLGISFATFGGALQFETAAPAKVTTERP